MIESDGKNHEQILIIASEHLDGKLNSSAARCVTCASRSARTPSTILDARRRPGRHRRRSGGDRQRVRTMLTASRARRERARARRDRPTRSPLPPGGYAPAATSARTRVTACSCLLKHHR